MLIYILINLCTGIINTYALFDFKTKGEKAAMWLYVFFAFCSWLGFILSLLTYINKR